MNRKDFLRITKATALGCAISGTPFNVLANAAPQRVLVLVHLKGGNDGLNTVIPIDQYDNLANLRGSIIPSIKTLLHLTNTVGLHPSMPEMRDLYSAGNVNIIQNVGTTNSCIPHRIGKNLWLESQLLSGHYAIRHTNTSLTNQLSEVVSLIRNGYGQDIYTVTLDDFDTHTNQRETQSQLLRELSLAIHSFYKQAKDYRFDHKLRIVVFSEFGRRIRENKYGGTDHGTSGPVLIIGNDVAGGITGNNPVITAAASVEDNLPVRHQINALQDAFLHQWLKGFPITGNGLPFFSSTQLLL